MLFPSLKNRGGFFSDYYLGTVFGRGTGHRKSLVTKEVETAFRILERLHERGEQKAGDVPALRETYARPLLRDVFGYHLAEGEKQIHPLFTSAEEEAQGRPPLLLAYVGDFAEDLDAKRDGKIPATQRLGGELARAKADLRYGLLLTGERVRLIRRRGDGPAGAYLELDLPACLESEDRDSFAAAHRLFRAKEFQPAEDGALAIDAVERESREHAEKVSEDLKRAVFDSAEILVQALLDARAGDSDPEAEDELTVLRDAALTCLYRLLFILYAEARDERLMSHAVYAHSYSLDRLVHQLMTLNEPPSPNRTGLWERVLALFALHRDGLPGVEGLDPLPARGSALFDPTSPDGQILQEVRLDDATMARLVLDLTTTSPRRGVGKERISFRELDIEQLGSVYEGLLEFEPRVADGTEIEVKVQGRMYALPPSELVRLVREKNLKLRGPAWIVAGTEAEPLHPDVASDESEAEDDLSVEEPKEAGTGDDEGTGEGVKTGAPAILIRRLEPGRFHFVPGPGRKGSGSFYTPLPLVQNLISHALGPLVANRTPAEIEGLRVLDPACGSAHFLVEAMRFLGRALHRSYVEELAGAAPPDFRGTWDGDWIASDQDARASGSEARAWCKRRVAERCLFGVDLNPTAVQLAQVSLWIESLAGDRPLTYFTHHVRCGNSILGTWLERLGEPPLPELQARQARDGGLMQDIFATQVREAIQRAAHVRRQIDEAAEAITAVGSDADPLAEQQFKEDRRKEAEEILAAARLLFDLRSASAFLPAIWEVWPNLCDRVEDAEELERYARSRPWWDALEEVRDRERFFHWELEFPEVFLERDRPGFDAALSNPPWGSEPIAGTVHALLPEYIHISGRRDAFAFFVERTVALLAQAGSLALVLPDVVLLKNYPSTRKLLLEATELAYISHWGQVFEDANIDVCTVVATTSKRPDPDHVVHCRTKVESRWVAADIRQDRFSAQPKYKFNLLLTEDLAEMLKSVDSLSQRFGDVFEAHEGIHSGNVREKLFVPKREDETCRRLLLQGKEVRPFHIEWAGRFVRYSEAVIDSAQGEYANLGRPEYFDRDKLLVRRTGDRVLAALDDGRHYVSNNFFVAWPRPADASLLHVAEVVLNSSLATWFFRSIQPRAGRLFAELKLEQLRLLPLPKSVSPISLHELDRLREDIARFWDAAPHDLTLPAELRARLDEFVFLLLGLPEEVAHRVRESADIFTM